MSNVPYVPNDNHLVRLTTMRLPGLTGPGDMDLPQGDVYTARWGNESLYGEMKSFMKVEHFHSGSVDGCEQEIAATMIWMALGSFMQAEAERTLNGLGVVRADCLRAASDLAIDALRGRSIAGTQHCC